MGKTPHTSPAHAAALADALESFLDIMLDGRSDDLDEKEQAAYDKATKALAAISDTPENAALHKCHDCENLTSKEYRCRECETLEFALRAFWAVVAAAHPEIRSGDGEYDELRDQGRESIREWVSNNTVSPD